MATLSPATGIDNAQSHQSGIQRYIQFFILLLAAGSIYPLIYLRQNFETTILETFKISSSELGTYYSMLGTIFLVTYLPSGWLADRVSPRLLLTFSMAVTGILGLWYASIPDKSALYWIFLGWGISSGLTFWAALLKGVKMLARPHEQGRFFGGLEGLRGLVEAILATAAVALFSYYVDGKGLSAAETLPSVIMLYVYNCFAVALLCFLFLGLKDDTAVETATKTNLLADLRLLMAVPELWLIAIIILCGYQLFWATYSFSAFLQEKYTMTASAAAFITVAKLWMRPIGGLGAGFLGDKIGRENILAITMTLSIVGLLALLFLPSTAHSLVLLLVVLLIGVMTYATRGLYWSILESSNIPTRLTGFAIGMISLIAYTPDIYLPKLNGYLADRYSGLAVYQMYFGFIAASGILGLLAIGLLKSRTKIRAAAQVPTTVAAE
ncbi:MFS transporter [Ensifer sp. HO-A22]|uniref:MFS transporter n=1 Tax=Ensifer oleiphilus TaxID=2742698 RepID=A0A7Y6Q9Z8_9HYPH|nr:MFS transporter [Ensifer oleiphilus]NVD41818.1 MFS transporter [Ensifer oleiphilus]